ncbi:MAG: hypothetical protein E6R04_10960 [Spirochaetes bacterium]|nr:MAG: hypothetical protein E6R04_10960 [Spirochaetota bacterium]
MSELTTRSRNLLNSAVSVVSGPWDHTDGVVWGVEVVADPSDPTGQTGMQQQVKVCDTAPGALANFIAAAPQLVADLTATLERIQKAIIVDGSNTSLTKNITDILEGR